MRVLVVDEDELVRSALVRALEHRGVDAMAVDLPLLAKKCVRFAIEGGVHFDIVVCDVDTSRGESGFEFAAGLQATYGRAAPKVVLATSYVSPNRLEIASTLDAWLVDKSDLVSLVDRVCAYRRLLS